MTKVTIYKKNENIVGFEVKDHAEFADYGQDIVCASISFLTFNTIDTFTDLLNLREKIAFEISNDDNLASIKFEIKDALTENEDKDSQLILKKYELGMKSLVNEYGDFIKVDYMEV